MIGQRYLWRAAPALAMTAGFIIRGRPEDSELDYVPRLVLNLGALVCNCTVSRLYKISDELATGIAVALVDLQCVQRTDYFTILEPFPP